MDKERERIRKEIFGKSKDKAQEPLKKEVNNIEVVSEINPGLLRMFPPERIKRLMEKEVRRYKASLEKKWSNWFKAVSK